MLLRNQQIGLIGIWSFYGNGLSDGNRRSALYEAWVRVSGMNRGIIRYLIPEIICWQTIS